MWHDFKFSKVERIEKCVAEYQIWMHTVLPYGKLKIKIYEDQDSKYIGITDIHVRRKFDGEFEGGIGYGNSIDEALKDTINCFVEIINTDYPVEKYPQGLSEEDIEYAEYSDF